LYFVMAAQASYNCCSFYNALNIFSKTSFSSLAGQKYILFLIARKPLLKKKKLPNQVKKKLVLFYHVNAA